MVEERALELGGDPVGQALAAHQHDGPQLVSQAAQVLSLCVGQWHRGIIRIRQRGRTGHRVAKRSKSSSQWLREHFDDPFVQRAQQEGWRSRAAFKLEELDRLEQLVGPGMVIVDLGAAPGGWSQYAARKLDGRGTVIALDILPMDEIVGVSFIEGDFREEEVLEKLNLALAGRPVDLVMSDMAPNMSGVDVSDQARAAYLVELALDFAAQVLRKDGVFVCKMFQGAGFQELLGRARRDFTAVRMRKPKASRQRSAETYLVARGRRSV